MISIFSKFEPFLKSQFQQNSNFRVWNCKIAIFDIQILPKLITCKIECVDLNFTFWKFLEHSELVKMVISAIQKCQKCRFLQICKLEIYQISIFSISKHPKTRILTISDFLVCINVTLEVETLHAKIDLIFFHFSGYLHHFHSCPKWASLVPNPSSPWTKKPNQCSTPTKDQCPNFH